MNQKHEFHESLKQLYLHIEIYCILHIVTLSNVSYYKTLQ